MKHVGSPFATFSGRFGSSSLAPWCVGRCLPGKQIYRIVCSRQSMQSISKTTLPNTVSVLQPLRISTKKKKSRESKF